MHMFLCGPGRVCFGPGFVLRVFAAPLFSFARLPGLGFARNSLGLFLSTALSIFFSLALRVFARLPLLLQLGTQFIGFAPGFLLCLFALALLRLALGFLARPAFRF